ncbi:MAG: glycosyltransferase family 4 protein [Bacteroidetes bacterium]|nr:glycosyltransferase family 4 protein [Bacteroidota bacterium]
MTESSKDKILILVPGENARGGITNYYYSIKKEFKHEVEYFLRGSRTYPFRESILKDAIQPFKDLWRFYKKIRKKEFSLLQTTTAFDDVSLIRDFMFIVLAKRYKMKVIVFFRGWDQSFAQKLEKKYLGLFKIVYFKADAIIELSSDFRKKLIQWGYKKKIYLETTLVNKELVKDLNKDEIESKYNGAENINILFLARIEAAKGIYETLDAYSLLKESYPNAKLTIAGDGRETDNVGNYIKSQGIKGVSLLGHVSGEEKIRCFKNSHIYLFPSYSEGMPNTVLEAMAFGLPVVTRKVGGLVDFFENDVNGYFTNSKDPEVFAGFIEKLLKDKALLRKISQNNFNYAAEKFLSDKVALRIEKIFDEVLEKNNKKHGVPETAEFKDQKKILILVPGENARGGISNYYYSIKKEFQMPVDYFVRGARNYPYRQPYFKDLGQSVLDIFNFIRIIRKRKYSLIQTSTSLDDISVIRDCLFILAASFYKIDVVVFYRGWKKTFQNKLENTFIETFKKIFFKAKCSIVLSSEFKDKLIEWGYDKPVYIETTLVDSELVKNFNTTNIEQKFSNIVTPKILFLSRIEVAKGIYETIDTFVLLQKKYRNIKLTIAGDGLEEAKVIKYIDDHKIKNINITGHLTGNEKIHEFVTSHIFFLPSYTEGMPVTVCEAMAFGLPVITREVGGLKDFFVNGENGYFTDSKDPKCFYQFADNLFSDTELMKKIALNNYEYSRNHFLSSNVARRIEKIFTSVVN